MKYLLSFALLFMGFHNAFAKDGYEIKINFKQPVENEYVYIAHYYAKPMPTVYKTDSTKVINKKTAVFKSKEKVLGGMYLLLFNDNKNFFEFILENGSQFEITVDTTDIPKNLTFKNSNENTQYVNYQKELAKYGERQSKLNEKMSLAKNEKDSNLVREEMKLIPKELKQLREKYIQLVPNTFLAKVFTSLMNPEIPEGPHYLADGKTIDSTFEYYYYKNHYWDNFDFKDDRLINAPIFDGRLTEYFTKLVIPIPDSMNKESDEFLKRIPKDSELFKYSLYFLAKNAESSQVMGMDEVFVYLVENYYMKGYAWWLDSASLAKYEDRARKIAPNVLGNKAPDLELQDIWQLQNMKLSDVKADYTVLVFWSPSCGHCKTEIPLLDSVYNAQLKDMGVEFYSVPTEGDIKDIRDMVKKFGIQDWVNAVDITNKKAYKDLYDVYATPKIYLLDKDKKIVGKGIDHKNIIEVIEFDKKKKERK